MGATMQIKDKVAIVTGAAGGIGAALAEALLAGGARVVDSDLDGERLAATADRLRLEIAPLRGGNQQEEVGRLVSLGAVPVDRGRPQGA